MVEVRFKPKYYSVNIGPMFAEEFVGKLGPIAEGIVENGFWHPELPYEGAKKFFQAYIAKYQKTPSTDAAYAYIGSQIMQQAIEQAGTLDREKIAQQLRTGKFSTILGQYEYDQNGVNKSQLIFLCQIQGGKRVIVWPKNIASAELKPFPQ